MIVDEVVGMHARIELVAFATWGREEEQRKSSCAWLK